MKHLLCNCAACASLGVHTQHKHYKAGVDILEDSQIRRGKIKLKIGNLSFAGEGDQDWLDRQINKLIDRVEHVQNVDTAQVASASPEAGEKGPTGTQSLAKYLKAKGGDTVQNQRFLATAAWLCTRGEEELTTRAVAKALQDNQQKRLGNPSDCLNQNVGRGFCEKTANGFFITREGWDNLGESRA